MGDNWPPDAPEMGRDFKTAQQGQEKQDTQEREAVTKAEAVRLKSERERDQPAPALTPGHAQTLSTENTHAIAREQRIAYIKERMGSAQERMRSGWDRGRD
ncbi:MAG: hypothetical protein L3K26_00010 [Candidatus Hydrogenedentes bacterium]|nr:hypothetical protein [Candidatus Hydrogenedentota bacterium]